MAVKLKSARSVYAEKVAIRKDMLAEHRGRAWPINLEPNPGGRFALHQALQEESAARKEYMRVLRTFNDLMHEGDPFRRKYRVRFWLTEKLAAICIGSPP